MLIVTVPLAAALLLFFLVLLPSQMFSVPFSTFKQNFDAAQRVAVVLTYGNQSQFVAESQCATQVIQLLAHSRNATTIDFYILNQTMCTYPKGGLGHEVTILNDTPGNCLAMVGPEPTIFLNHSATNYSVVTAYRLYTYGNPAFMLGCPIAISLS